MFPILRYRVKGRSMLPEFREGDYLIVNRLGKLKKGDAVVLKHPKTNELILKRISWIKDEKYYVLGDNKKQSTDSRSFGYVERQMIVGKVMFKVGKI